MIIVQHVLAAAKRGASIYYVMRFTTRGSHTVTCWKVLGVVRGAHALGCDDAWPQASVCPRVQNKQPTAFITTAVYIHISYYVWCILWVLLHYLYYGELSKGTSSPCHHYLMLSCTFFSVIIVRNPFFSSGLERDSPEASKQYLVYCSLIGNGVRGVSTRKRLPLHGQ